MTTYELAKQIRSSYLGGLQEIMVGFKEGSDAFKQAQDLITRIHRSEIFKKINPNDFSIDEAKDLDFVAWNENNYLIPGWMFFFLEERFNGFSILNEEEHEIILEEQNPDTRFGCLSFGIKK